MSRKLGECADCHEPIRFVRMRATGRAMPVNLAPNPSGNVATTGHRNALVGHVVSTEQPARLGEVLYLTHYATCTARPKKPATP